jgi:dTDP-4-amino-4,6-dideoxygalactose transaminase
MFYMVCENAYQRDHIIKKLKEHKVHAVFHYLSLHKSPFYKKNHGSRGLENADNYSEQLFRLPLFYELSETDVKTITKILKNIEL